MSIFILTWTLFLSLSEAACRPWSRLQISTLDRNRVFLGPLRASLCCSYTSILKIWVNFNVLHNLQQIGRFFIYASDQKETNN